MTRRARNSVIAVAAVALATGLLVAAASCGSTGASTNLLFLDRPSDVTFGCIGSLTGSDGGAPQTVVLSPLACNSQISPSPNSVPIPDAGASVVNGVSAATALAFVVEAPRGDMAIAKLNGSASFLDSDPYTPGLNGLPVGRLPVAVATTADGCFAVTANAGSCDLGVVSVLKAALTQTGAQSRLKIRSTAGVMTARPSAIVGPPSLPATTPPSFCPTTEGIVYVAFPGCHLIARVDLSTGDILDGVKFPLGAPPELVGPDVTCPVECNAEQTSARPISHARSSSRKAGPPPLDVDAGDIDLDAGEPDAPTFDARPVADGGPLGDQVDVDPVALSLEPDGTRLYVGGFDSPNLIVVDLGADGAFTHANSVELEGAQGIRRVAATGEIAMGQDGLAGPYRFVYAIGKDSAIHVVDVTPTHPLFECDTQIDRRFLHDFTNITLLQCFPVGGPMDPPRRAEADGPGIRLIGDALPLDVAFTTANETLASIHSSQPYPPAFNGTFAVIASFGPDQGDTLDRRGWIYFVNVNDNNYEDFQTTFDPLGPDIGLALPHTLRDNVTDRRHADNCVEETFATGAFGNARIDTDPGAEVGFSFSTFGALGDPFAPMLHRIVCNPTTSEWELASSALRAVRGPLYADLEEIPDLETFNVTWQGELEGGNAARAGGRAKVVDTSTLSISEPGGLFCQVGVEDKDIVRLLGCDGDADCDYSELCFHHPEAPAGVSGLCFPADQVDDLAVRCHDALVTTRDYTVVRSADDEVLIQPRPRVLDESPLAGCTDDAQCMTVQEATLAKLESFNGLVANSYNRFKYTCQADPGRGGPTQCIEACTTSTDCELGTSCEDGICVLGPIPTGECLTALQRFEFRAGDAFVVLSSVAGYRNRMIEDPASGLCVENTALSPLIVGRFHRDEPACTDTSVSSLTPNPCSEQLDEPVVGGATLTTRSSASVHFRTPGLTFDISDIGTPVPGMPDQLYSPVTTDYTFTFRIAGGFLPYAVNVGAQLPKRIVTGPDGSLWIVDAGDALSEGPRGQLINAAIDGVRATLF